jgi:hypothetical protein
MTHTPSQPRYANEARNHGDVSLQSSVCFHCLVEFTKFMQSKIYDSDLPFNSRSDGAFHEVISGSTKSQQRLSFLGSKPWEPLHCDSFRIYQREVSAPIFKFSWVAGEKVLHYPLSDQVVLPLIHVEDTSKEDELPTTIRRLGGTSIVRKANIHSAHYNAFPGAEIGERHLNDMETTGSKGGQRGPER